MAKRKEISPVERLASSLASELKNIEKRIAWNICPKNPTRQFTVNERVHWGALNESYILEVYEGGLYYKIVSKNVQRERSKPAEDEIRLVEWNELYSYHASKPTTFTKKENYRLKLYNTGIDSLFNRVYFAGVDFDVDYQRDHVWKMEDKIALIDSIFNNIDIGKFVFVQRNFSVIGKLYEIIDGKQRLTTLCEFYENRFRYNGFLFTELSPEDKNKFKNHGITMGDLENPDKRAIFETFIKLNTCGKPMDNKHILKVKKLLSKLE